MKKEVKPRRGGTGQGAGFRRGIMAGTLAMMMAMGMPAGAMAAEAGTQPSVSTAQIPAADTQTAGTQAADAQTAAPAAQLVTAQSISLSGKAVQMNVGESKTVTVDYAKVAGGYADLGVVSSNPEIVQAVLTDAGNGKATLTVTSASFGTATVAVYVNSNPAVASYISVSSGFAQKGKSYTLMQGQTVTTVYDDRSVSYNAVMNGSNGAALTVQSVSLTRESGFDKLRVTGSLSAQDSKLPGLSAFYANYYDAAGMLIKRQAVYVEKPLNYSQVELDWYLPDGCVQVVLE
ncbi:MAG: hypothetical protein Q4C60_02785 [Eubacteriales bacterium]|nr:hypothetical protein [Eubacteriales bacterium]